MEADIMLLALEVEEARSHGKQGCSSRNWKEQENGFSPRVSGGNAALRMPWSQPSETYFGPLISRIIR